MSSFFRRGIEKFKTIISLLYVPTILYIIPLYVYWYLIPVDKLYIPYSIALGSIFFTNCLIYIEDIAAHHENLTSQQRFVDYYDIEKDDINFHQAVIFPCYLPNEIVVLKTTLENIIKCDFIKSLRVVVVHNKGSELDKQKLRRIIHKLEIPDRMVVVEIECLDSCTKAQNVNFALDYLKKCDPVPDIVSLFDADHQPRKKTLVNAMKDMVLTKSDVVQGRCVVHKGSYIIGIEFDLIYGIHHCGGNRLRGFGLFGGSNGHWKLKVFDEIRLDPTMLTEDIDSTFRALKKGYKIIYDKNVVSFEEAPPSLKALIVQRRRWASGWFEVSLRHSKLCFDTNLPRRQRVSIFLLLVWREMYTYISSQALPTSVVYILKCGWGCANYSISFISLFLFSFSLIQSLNAHLTSGSLKRPNSKFYQYIVYVFVSFPYEILKYHISAWGQACVFFGKTRWIATKRT